MQRIFNLKNVINMVNKNVLMNQKFNDLSLEDKIKVLGIDDNVLSNGRYKYYTKETIVSDMWNGKTNSEKRKLLKNSLCSS